jgi:hypothetical protein
VQGELIEDKIDGGKRILRLAQASTHLIHESRVKEKEMITEVKSV